MFDFTQATYFVKAYISFITFIILVTKLLSISFALNALLYKIPNGNLHRNATKNVFNKTRHSQIISFCIIHCLNLEQNAQDRINS